MSAQVHMEDWFEEESHARTRTNEVRSGRGLRRVSAIALDSGKLWATVLVTGVGIGVLGGWLDILVAWCVLDTRRQWRL